jgi:hypothetical protein
MTIFEERRTLLHKGAQPDHLKFCRETLWRSLAQHDGQLVCLLHGLIGNPIDELVQITRYPDVATWERTQPMLPSRSALVEKEEARLLRAIASRPKEQLPQADQRPVYGYRRFFIRPADLDEFVRCSAEGVWPRIETQGSCILGLWATLAQTNPLEIVLLTGYQSVANWGETRANVPMPPNMDPALWEASAKALARRNELTLRTWVCLMRALEFGASNLKS